MLTRKDVVAGLRELGVRSGATLMVHSSYLSLGGVAGGPETVVDALLEVLGPSGTLMMPAFNFTHEGPFDAGMPSTMGVITEVFRKSPGVIRTLHPTHSVCVKGRRAGWLVRDHLKAPTACGAGTPFGRICEAGGGILLMGVDHDRNTILHTVEDYADLPYLNTIEAWYRDGKGRKRKLVLRRYPGPHRNFIGIDRFLTSRGIQRIGKIGTAVCRLVDARRMVDTLVEEVRRDPALFLCGNPACGDCVRQRGMIRLRRLEREDFRLAVSLPPEGFTSGRLLHLAQAHGVRYVELDTGSRKLSRSLAESVAETLRQSPMRLCSIRSGAAADSIAGAMKLLKPEMVVVPRRSAVRPSFVVENAGESSRDILEFLEGRPGSQMAFNPAAFAGCGEKPFLDVYSKRRLGRYIALLYFVDGTFSGEPRYPVEGNGELKEMLSILRCRSFSGYVVVRSPGGECTLEGCLERFWRALDEI